MQGRDVLMSISGLRKAFGGLVAVRDISFDIERCGILGLIGPNGSGKTTVLNLITAEFPADSGSIRFQGRSCSAGDLTKSAAPASRAPSSSCACCRGMTALENVMLGRMFGSEPVAPTEAAREAETLIARVGLGRSRESSTVPQLTYIDQKRVELARALATRPQLLLLDEWLAGLNPTELQVGIELIRQIQSDGVTIVMIEHVMEAIRALCDTCVVMNAGENIARRHARRGAIRPSW